MMYDSIQWLVMIYPLRIPFPLEETKTQNMDMIWYDMTCSHCVDTICLLWKYHIDINISDNVYTNIIWHVSSVSNIWTIATGSIQKKLKLYIKWPIYIYVICTHMYKWYIWYMICHMRIGQTIPTFTTFLIMGHNITW